MKFISLFCGIGGFDYALEKLGHECVWANDFNKYAAQIYDKNFNPRKTTTDDIRTIPNEDIPDHDLLVGGFPCQAFSIAGKRGGFDDTRGTLFFEVARILRDKKPRLFILENVKGLLSHDNGNTFKTIISTLVELRYDIQWQVLNSKNFGVPQNRERVFIIGHLRGTSRPEVFPFTRNNPTSLNYLGAVMSERNQQWLEDGKQLSRNFPQGQRVYTSDGIASTLASNAGGLGAKTGLYAMVIDHGVIKERDHVNTLDANYYKGLDNHQARTGIAWSKSHRTGSSEYDKHRHNYGKVEERVKIGEFNTLNTGEGCRTQSSQNFVVEATKIRRLTPLECERLQGFPDGWTKEGLDKDGKIVPISDTQRYKCLGNAVTTNVVYEIAKLL